MSFKKKLVIMIIVSILVTLPNDLLTRSIVPVAILSSTGQILYSVLESDLVKNEFWAYFFLFYNLLTGFFLYLSLLGINILVIFRFKKYLKNKHSIENIRPQTQVVPKKKSKKESVTRLMLAIVAVFLSGNVPFSLFPVFVIFLGRESLITSGYLLLTTFIIILSHNVYIFVYYLYCDAYRKMFRKIFFNQ